MSHYSQKQWLLITGIILPVAGMLAWLGNLIMREQSYQVFQVPVEGFDPRSPLSGHYLEYRIKHGSVWCSAAGDKSTNYAHNTCACFADTKITLFECGTGDCLTFVPITSCSSEGFQSSELSRYFFPDTLAPVLLRVPEKASIRIRVGKGWAKAEQMFVGEEKIEEWAAKAAK